MIFSDSVTQQFSDPRSISFKGPIPSFKSVPFGQETLFSPVRFRFPFFLLHSVVHQPPRPHRLPHPPPRCKSARFEFSFLPSSALLGPRPL